jgi:hypothetical protein
MGAHFVLQAGGMGNEGGMECNAQDVFSLTAILAECGAGNNPPVTDCGLADVSESSALGDS